MRADRLHILHLLHRFDTGGLENGVVNLINRLDEKRYRHSIVALQGICPEFAQRVLTANVEYFDLAKQPGQDLGVFKRLNSLLKQLSPDVVHTRNTATLEMQIVAWWRRIPLRIHGEHGWDVNDLKGQSQKFRILKKFMKYFVHQYITLSKEAETYITNVIGVNAKRVNRICNGVDINKFSPGPADVACLPQGFRDDKTLVFGTVGRLATVKNQGLLLEAFIQLVQQHPQTAINLRLLIVGDGVLMKELVERSEQANVNHQVHFAGNSNQVSQLMRAMDVFLLPSLAEGISNTFLEAMATGLPVIATNVGGNPDLIMPEHRHSHLVAVGDHGAMASAMAAYVYDAAKLENDSCSVRQYCVANFGIEAMVTKYHQVYQSFLRIRK